MIDRYTRPKLKDLWSEENKYKVWLQVELACLEALAELGLASPDACHKIKQKAKFDVKRIEEIDKEVHHDVIAFLTNLNENIGQEGRFLHLGMTSSDLVDTANSILLKQAGKEIISDLDIFLETLRQRALDHKQTVCIGRTHGVHAEPTTFGLKLLCFYNELYNAKEKFEQIIQETAIGMFSGAVGTYSNINPNVEEIACKKLGLLPAKITTQVITREKHSRYLNELALIATLVEKVALEVRHLQRTEVLEVEEPFYENQKGSSAMPHKRNPWRSENLCGLARLVRSYALTAMENIPLWHERDISHSSVERIIFPDATTIVDFMLARINEIIAGLNVYPENMKENMFKFGGVVFSQGVLLKLVDKGLTREEAYKIVQRNAHRAWNKKNGDFKRNLLEDKEVTKHLTKDEIEESFNPLKYLSNVDLVFERLLNENLTNKEKCLTH